MSDVGDLVARARGLSGHLLQGPQLAPLCGAASIAALAEQLAALRILPARAPTPLDEHALELLLRRQAAARLALLADWAGARRDLLAPLFDDQDRRTLRALVRGAIAGVAPEMRLRGLIATPELGQRALEQLSRAGDISTIAASLLTWGHPFGAALAEEARRQRPDLLQLETTLTRTFAQRAHRLAPSGDVAMARFVERTIDLENLRTALVLAEHPCEISPASLFIEGGALVAQDDLCVAAKARSSAALAAHLSARLPGTALLAVLEPGERAADDAALQLMAVEQRELARREPLGLAPVILFALRQRQELGALLRILWSISLGMPRAAIERAIGGAA